MACADLAAEERRVAALLPPPPSKPCDWCDETFESKYHQANYCSIPCRRAAGKRRAKDRGYRDPWSDKRRDAYQRRRALKKGTAVAGRPVLRDEIAARDKYRCGICGDRVDMAKAWPHPKSPSLDHVIPLQPADGSEPGTHTPENVQLAHLICNTAKGNRAANDQLILFG